MEGGVTSLVAPQNCLFLTSFSGLRKRLLKEVPWEFVAALGAKAFQTPMWDFNVMLLCLTSSHVCSDHEISGLNVAQIKEPREKANHLKNDPVVLLMQKKQLANPDAKVVIGELVEAAPLRLYAQSYQGLKTGDDGRLRAVFWELRKVTIPWRYFQSTVSTSTLYAGRESILRYENRGADIARNQGQGGWGKIGVAISQMATLPATLFMGDTFDSNVAPILPFKKELLPALCAFCFSSDFVIEIRKLDQKVAVANATFGQVTFDFPRWQKVATRKYPDGLPEPESDDPTQWLFHGRPDESTAPLQVAVARLLGYRWPAELDGKMRLSERSRILVKRCGELAKFADDDGIVCIPAVRGEEPAAEQLFRLLTACNINPDIELDDWLRNGFFEEHCKLFHDRPFVWHIWDGRKRDGFHALVNYHKLCEGGGKGRRLLESLTYAYLGEWITRQKDDVKRGEGGAEDRLAAALELQKRLVAILEGEPPFDIFVRWKPLAKQPIGWEPDINDGVRLNIRPFLTSVLPGGRTGAGILRYKPNIKWTKDRGKEPLRPKAEYPWFWSWDEKATGFLGGKTFDGNRWNDCHYTNKTKQMTKETITHISR